MKETFKTLQELEKARGISASPQYDYFPKGKIELQHIGIERLVKTDDTLIRLEISTPIANAFVDQSAMCGIIWAHWLITTDELIEIENSSFDRKPEFYSAD